MPVIISLVIVTGACVTCADRAERKSGAEWYRMRDRIQWSGRLRYWIGLGAQSRFLESKLNITLVVSLIVSLQ